MNCGCLEKRRRLRPSPPPVFRPESINRYNVPRDVNFRIPQKRTPLVTDEATRQLLCSLWWHRIPITEPAVAWKILKDYSVFSRNPNWSDWCLDDEEMNRQREKVLERARLILRNERVALPL